MPNAQPQTPPTPIKSVATATVESFIIVAQVAPRESALERVFAVLRRRAPALSGFNVSAGDATAAARITMSFQATPAAAEQVTEQLRKLVDVESASCFPAARTPGAAVVRELALIRMRSAAETRREIIDVARLFAARIVDVREGYITLEASGPTSSIEHVLTMLRPLGVEEILRSGAMALPAISPEAPFAEGEERADPAK